MNLVKKLQDCLNKNDIDWTEFCYEVRDGYLSESLQELLTKNDLKVELEDAYGGEGQGDCYWIVFWVKSGKDKILLKQDGWYASYEGGTLDGDLTEVKPVEKVVIEYEDVRTITSGY